MEFHDKLQRLRKEKGLTQEELAQLLYVSRTAVSKWESGRGYPSIDSLKSIATFFGITVDMLLSGEKLLQLSETACQGKDSRRHDLLFGLLDCSTAIFFFLPLFGQWSESTLHEVSLSFLTEIHPLVRAAYLTVTAIMIIWGIMLLALQNSGCNLWITYKYTGSFALSAAGLLLFIISPQPYAAALLFVFLAIKAWFLFKK